MCRIFVIDDQWRTGSEYGTRVVPGWRGWRTHRFCVVLPGQNALPSPLGYVGRQPLITTQLSLRQQPSIQPEPPTAIQRNATICATLSSLRGAVPIPTGRQRPTRRRNARLPHSAGLCSSGHGRRRPPPLLTANNHNRITSSANDYDLADIEAQAAAIVVR
jgi:hypothetical protein